LIAYLYGKLKFFDEEKAVLLVGNGVGYEAYCSKNTLEDIHQKTEVELFIHTHVREDALQLFGFSTLAEKEVFLSLISVNGIGPKVALKILSGTKVTDLIRWIDEGNIGALTQLPKVGKKTAEQILFSLKDKLLIKHGPDKTTIKAGVKKDIYSALVNLGYSPNEVEKTVAPMQADIEFQEGVREGLAQLSGH
jgi:holliday junction DNA helicase RuvA